MLYLHLIVKCTFLYFVDKLELMKELDFIKIINNITQSSYLGDDCAYLKDLGIVVTQDNFVENVHFKRDWATPYQIGYKAAAVNVSDVLASGAVPAYISVGLSLPKDIDSSFIKDFYKGVQAGSYGAEIIGGDITGGDSILVSITAIGKTEKRRISSRANAQKGYVVIASSEHGKSSAGLEELFNNGSNQDLILAHLEPKLDVEFSNEIASKIDVDYAMMDSSDGLADALFKIAQASSVKIVVDKNVKGLFGSEDYKLVAAIPEFFLNNITNYIKVGKVVEFDGNYLKIGNKEYLNYDDLRLYDHFGGKND